MAIRRQPSLLCRISQSATTAAGTRFRSAARRSRSCLSLATSVKLRHAQVKIAGSDLNALRGDRNVADYSVDQALVQRQALLQIQSADRLIQILDAAVDEPACTQIAEGMRNYERDVLKEVTWKA